ncbi:MAG: hypothetical protein ACOX52_18530 [Verrucomicrobiota bacterium]|jgi:hypothetical protein
MAYRTGSDPDSDSDTDADNDLTDRQPLLGGDSCKERAFSDGLFLVGCVNRRQGDDNGLDQ